MLDCEDSQARRAPLGLDISKRLQSLARAVAFTDQAASVSCELRPDRELERNFVRSARQERASQAGGQTVDAVPHAASNTRLHAATTALRRTKAEDIAIFISNKG